MEQKDNLLGVVSTIFKWKKIILWTCAVTAIGAAIVSLILPVYYKSTTIFYAASPDLAIPEAIFGNSSQAPDYYGIEDDIDRLLSIAKSGELATFMIDSFNLYQHYDIDSKSRLGPYTVRLEFSDHFDVIKTKYDAIELSIEDKDKELATRMTNAARNHINWLAQKLIKDGQAKILAVYKNNIEQKEKGMATMNDSLLRVRQRYGVFNTKAQSEIFSKLIAEAEAKFYNDQAKVAALQASRGNADTIRMLKANISGYEAQGKRLNERLNTFNLGMAQVDGMAELQLQVSEALAEDQERYKQIQAAYNSDFLAVLLLEEGQVPIIKSRPKRALLVVAATAIAFVFSVIGVLIFDTYREVNWKQILHI